jgi:hypothetical protein
MDTPHNVSPTTNAQKEFFSLAFMAFFLLRRHTGAV